MAVLDQFAEWLAALDTRSFSAGERAKLDDHIYDTARARAVGATTPDGEALAALRLPAVAEAVAWARLTEIDDIDRASGTTPGSVAVSTAEALATQLGVSDADELRTAACAGYEAMVRLGRAINGQQIGYRGIWASYFCAPFAAAAAAARLMRLDTTQTAHALSIALTMGAGRAGPTVAGRPGRWLLIGLAAYQGTLAARAAANGTKGDLKLLDGTYLERTQGLPGNTSIFESPDILFGEVSLKPYCSAKQLLSAIEGVQQLLARGIAASDIETVSVALPSDIARMVDHSTKPGDRLASISGAPYQLSVAALAPDALYDIVRETLIPVRLPLRIMADASLDMYLPAQWPARVTIEANGRKEEILVLDSLGDPAKPMDRAALEAKHAAVSRVRS